MKRSLIAFLFTAMIALAQRQSPQPSQHAQKSLKPIVDRFQRFRYRMAFSTSSAHVAGFQDVVVKSGSRGAPAQSPLRVQPGMNKNTDVTLKRGIVTQDSSFAQWVNRGQAPSRVKDLVIDAFDETGQKSSSMHLGGCVVAEYQSAPDLDGPANNATIRIMTLHCTSIKRSTR